LRSKLGGIVIVKLKIIGNNKNKETIPQSHCVRQLPLHKGAYFYLQIYKILQKTIAILKV